MVAILHVIREVYALLKFINLDYHPNDSRIGIKKDDVCQSLTSRMGTGGGNVGRRPDGRDGHDALCAGDRCGLSAAEGLCDRETP